MAVKVGINGFGRIGRNVFRTALGNPEIEFVAVNDLTSPATLAHLLKYDSILGNLHQHEIEAGDDFISVDGKKIKVFAERDPCQAALGRSRRADRGGIDRPLHRRHQGKGAPGRDREEGHHLRARDERRRHACARRERRQVRRGKAQRHLNASCTTNGLAPVVKVLHDTFTITSGIMTTIHSYTNDQVILDFPHKDLRRARAAAINMIPSTTGAAKALKLVIQRWMASWTASPCACPRRTSRSSI